MDFPDDYVQKALDYDPLAEAEKITGEEYKHDKFTSALGFDLMRRSVEAKQHILSSRSDTYRGNSIQYYREVAEQLGFVKILEIKSQRQPHWPEYWYEDTWFAYWHFQHSVLLIWETYSLNKVNTAKIYFNWKPNTTKDLIDLRYSGSGNNGVLIGDIYAEEALAYNFNKMLNTGTFLQKWIETPWLWLPSYTEKHDDYQQINHAKLEMFPQSVRNIIIPDTTEEN
jgi:hypothetical protein